MNLNLLRYKAGFFPVHFPSVSRFVGYCERHSETPRQLFSRDQVVQLCYLAGLSSPINVAEWQSVDLADVCSMVRERLRCVPDQDVIETVINRQYAKAIGVDATTLGSIVDANQTLAGADQAQVLIRISEEISEILQDTILPTELDRVLNDLLAVHPQAKAADFAAVIQAVLLGTVKSSRVVSEAA